MLGRVLSRGLSYSEPLVSAVLTAYMWLGREEPSECGQFQGIPEIIVLFPS